MQKKLTITIDEFVYDGLYQKLGKGRISQFIESLVRPHVLPDKLDQAYSEMASDKEREKDALEWSEAFVGDADNESW